MQDTAGAERYQAMSSMYYRNAKAAVICFGKRLIFKFKPEVYVQYNFPANDYVLKIYMILWKFQENIPSIPCTYFQPKI